MAQRNAAAVGEWNAELDAVEKSARVLRRALRLLGRVHGDLHRAAVRGRARTASRRPSSGWPASATAGLRTVSLRRARKLTVPVLFLFQWDDELMEREHGMALFDAIGSAEKTMHVNPGGHLQMPPHERDAVEAFFRRHIPPVE